MVYCASTEHHFFWPGVICMKIVVDLDEIIQGMESQDNIHKYNIAGDWYKFRDEALKRIAVEWCEDNEISYK